MNKKQWNATAIVFLVFSLISQFGYPIWSGTYGLEPWTELDTAGFLANRIYGALTIIFWAGFFICLACGHYEKVEGKKK